MIDKKRGFCQESGSLISSILFAASVAKLSKVTTAYIIYISVRIILATGLAIGRASIYEVGSECTANAS